MDAFSWFRQRRQTPPGHTPSPSEDIHLPLTTLPTLGMVVYFRLGPDGTPPDEEAMRPLVAAYLERHASEPLREGLLSFLDQGLLSLIPQDRETVPEPPEEILRAYNPGEIEERRYRNATHALYIGTTDLLLPPRVGLWATLATARALAGALPGGVLMDPEFPRLIPLSDLQADLPPRGQIHVVDHILVQVTQTRNGLVHLATAGMGRFGLPDVELRDVPPNLSASVLPLVNGVAQRLSERAMAFAAESGRLDEDRPEYLPLRSEFPLTLSGVRRAYESVEEADGAEEAADAQTAAPDSEAEAEEADPAVWLRLAMASGQRGQPSRVRILPPAAHEGGPGVWLNEALSELFGSDPQLALIESGDAGMEDAHQRAVEELPRVRSRFQTGFRSGEVLHVKHGFETEQGREYMWIAVTAWNGDRIRGSLANDTQYRPDLRAGQTVEIPEAEVFDWLIVHSDGRMEGAYTNRLLEDEIDAEE